MEQSTTRRQAQARAQDKHDERKAQVWRALREAYLSEHWPVDVAERLATVGATAIGPLL